MDDLDDILESAKHIVFQEPYHPFILNKLSTLSASKYHIKIALKERIRELTAAYISLATFIDDDEVFEILNDSKLSKRVYKRVLRNIEKNDEEIRAFLRDLGTNTDALDT